MISKKSFDTKKKLNREYIDKLCVLLNSNDKNYSNKRFNLRDLVLKMNQSNQEYLTRKDFNKKNLKENKKNNSTDNIKSNSNYLLKKNNNEREEMDNLILEFKKKIIVLNEKLKENDDNDNLNNKQYEKFENLNNLLKTKTNKFINNKNKLNNSQSNISKISYSNLNFYDEKEKEELRNLNIIQNVNKLISKVKMIREYKNKTKKMDPINLFSFKKSFWNHKRLFNNDSPIKEDKINIKKQDLPENIFNIFKKENKLYKNLRKKNKSQEFNFANFENEIAREMNKSNNEENFLNKNYTLYKMKEGISEIYKLINDSKIIKKMSLIKLNRKYRSDSIIKFKFKN